MFEIVNFSQSHIILSKSCRTRALDTNRSQRVTAAHLIDQSCHGPVSCELPQPSSAGVRSLSPASVPALSRSALPLAPRCPVLLPCFPVLPRGAASSNPPGQFGLPTRRPERLAITSYEPRIDDDVLSTTIGTRESLNGAMIAAATPTSRRRR